MAPAASITDACPDRATHGAVSVRLVHNAPAARPRTQTQSAHAAACAPICTPVPTVPREGPHTPMRTHTRTHTCTHARTHALNLHACTHANTRTHTRTRKHHRTARENTQLAVNAESRARAQIRTAHNCSWAHGRYRQGGSARTSAVGSAAESRLPIACVHARTHACMPSISCAIRRCCDAQVSATAGTAQLPITSRHICAPIYAQTNAQCIRMYP